MVCASAALGTARAPGEFRELPRFHELSHGLFHLAPEDHARLEPFVDALSGGLSISSVPDTRDLRITFTHGDKQIAAAVANTVAEVFIQHSFQSKTEKFTNASDWLDRST